MTVGGCASAFVNVLIVPSITGTDSFGVIDLFAQRVQFIGCASNCGVNVSVKWCVRLFYLDGNIETCISLDDDQNPVFESTCDAQLLGLEEHLSLPSDEVSSSIDIVLSYTVSQSVSELVGWSVCLSLCPHSRLGSKPT